MERRRWKADRILIENASVGHGLFSDLKRDMRGLSEAMHCSPGCAPILIRPDGSKQDRFFTSVERLYNGFAKLPREAPWLDALRHELISFPDGRNDDQVDSISQFLNWACARVSASCGTDREIELPFNFRLAFAPFGWKNCATLSAEFLKNCAPANAISGKNCDPCDLELQQAKAIAGRFFAASKRPSDGDDQSGRISLGDTHQRRRRHEPG
jgi:hypothetical protein